PEALQAQIEQMSSPWFRFYLDYDPLPALGKVKCPVLALTGDHDVQVPSHDTLPLIEKALKDGGNKDELVKEMPGLNHLFQHAVSGLPNEYGTIEETTSPEVLQLVCDWIAEKSRKK